VFLHVSFMMFNPNHSPQKVSITKIMNIKTNRL